MRGWLCRRKWKTIVQDYICSPHAESMRKRNQIVFNMVEAESEYVHQLYVLVNCFLRPLRMAASSKKPPISHDDVSSIFLNRYGGLIWGFFSGFRVCCGVVFRVFLWVSLTAPPRSGSADSREAWPLFWLWCRWCHWARPRFQGWKAKVLQVMLFETSVTSLPSYILCLPLPEEKMDRWCLLGQFSYFSVTFPVPFFS